jgi:hypothetical protein
MDGKFMVLSRDRSAEVFDPTASTWRRWEDMISFRIDMFFFRCSFVVACSSSGELYAFSERQQKVMKYDGGKQVWTVVASLPRLIYLFKCATQCGDHIFVSGMCNPGKHISYLFKPSTGQWSQVNGDGGVIVSAATVEI